MSTGIPEEVLALAGRFERVLASIERAIRPNVTTASIESTASAAIQQEGLKSSFKGYRGFPASITASVNDEVVHGLPGPRILHEGDLLKLHVGVTDGRVHCTQGWTYYVGEPTAAARRFAACGERALGAAVSRVRDGCPIRDLAAAIEDTLRAEGFSGCAKYGGHGIGREQHQPPFLPCRIDVIKDPGEALCSGDVLSVTVIAHAGSADLKVGHDTWGVRSRDGAPAILFSQMVEVREHEAFIILPPRRSAAAERS